MLSFLYTLHKSLEHTLKTSKSLSAFTSLHRTSPVLWLTLTSPTNSSVLLTAVSRLTLDSRLHSHSLTVKVMLRPTISRLVLLLLDSCGFVHLRRPSDERAGLSCWPSPVQSFSGPVPRLTHDHFYCLIFETLPLNSLQ
jgi:hypothetical protein